jgi:transcriptional regulator with XRE-family HTH domain
MPSLGETIRAARLAKGMTVRGMAKVIRVGRSSASEIEGDRWIPSERILLEVAATLGLDFDRLMVLAGRTRKDAGNKYHARITEYDGIRYDSRAEAKYAEGLDLAVRAGAIRGWIRQVRFLLGPARIAYRCDFLVFGADGVAVAVDVKGVVTERFRVIVKLWAVYGPGDLQVACKGAVEVIRGGGGTGS